jgi:hypothetical protein
MRGGTRKEEVITGERMAKKSLMPPSKENVEREVRVSDKNK